MDIIFPAMDEETKAQRGEVTCPRTHSRRVGKVCMNLSNSRLSKTLSFHELECDWVKIRDGKWVE